MSGDLYSLYQDIKRILTTLCNELCECGGRYHEAIDFVDHASDCPYVAAVGKTEITK